MAQNYKEFKAAFEAERKATAEHYEQLVKDGGYKEHHTALGRGYQTTKYDCWEEYSGKFGVGYLRRSHSDKSNNYHKVTYFVK